VTPRAAIEHHAYRKSADNIGIQYYQWYKAAGAWPRRSATDFVVVWTVLDHVADVLQTIYHGNRYL